MQQKNRAKGVAHKGPKIKPAFAIMGLFALQNNRKLFSNILQKNRFSLNLLGASQGSLTEGTPGTHRDPRLPFKVTFHTIKGLLDLKKGQIEF